VQESFAGSDLWRKLRREARTATAALSGVGVDEVEALPHQRLFKVQHHAGEIEEALGVDEEADGFRAAGVVGGFESGAEDEGAITLAGLGVEADVVAEAAATAALDADTQAAGIGRDAFLGHRDADAFEGVLGDFDGGLRAGLLALGGEQRHAREWVFVRVGRRSAHRLRGGSRDGNS